jgi:hypothetical protein
VLTFAIGALAPVALLASSAQAAGPPVPCPDPNGQCKKLIPEFTCVWDNGGGSYTAVFGYTNTGNRDLIIPIGSENGFSPDPADRGQGTTFLADASTTSALTITWTGTPPSWTVSGNTATASSSGTACQSDPVPMLANGQLLAAAGGLTIVALIATRRRRPAFAIPLRWRDAARG